MKHFFSFSTGRFSGHARRGALLLALGAVGPAAWGQSFGPMTSYATGPGYSPNGLALGDLNGDGRPDIVTTHYNVNLVGVLLSQTGGGFAPISTYSTGPGSGPSEVALSDVNGDGRLDIVSANGDSNSIGVLLGAAGGSFGAVTLYSTGLIGSRLSGPRGVAVGDVNADGRPDVVATIHGAHVVGVLLGQAGGGLAPASTYASGAPGQYGSPNGLALGDINGDGRLDIAVANNTNVGVLLGQATGGFAPASTYASGMGLVDDVALADVTGDGRVDIVSVMPFANSAGAIGVLAGQASGFAPLVMYPSGGTLPHTVALGDLNGDGRLDMATDNYTTNNIAVLQGQAGGGFVATGSYPTGPNSNPVGVLLHDLNGDGRLDIVALSYSAVGVFLNTGTYLSATRPTAADLSLAPNPAHDAFTVTLPAGAPATHAELLNALGQVVRRPAGSGASFRVETAGLAPGVYTLRLRAGGAALARRVVVE
ncbi:T9SS type A sorting domain-containing protein [Hymenobacter sp. M29]|uniref:T9SS type A sorting domain-containing protein n=1 Tax=Hymenobacter mellowenesis TaxID=3063995 RepID=A0ABT9AGL9_9BACT|nr:T9SS type A sorting domain-containing protein [Hymenobacter sp. M29]MDO7848986.1 T9SS type A sorting domain-containing protein [Hymenobacter sp. M29]